MEQRESGRKYKADLLSYCTARYDKKWYDFDSRPRTLGGLAELCFGKEIDVLAITNHEDDRYSRIRDAAAQRHGFSELKESGKSVAMVIHDSEYRTATLVRGQKVLTNEGALNAVGIYEHIPSGEPMAQTIKRVKDMNGILIALNPFLSEQFGNIPLGLLNSHLNDFDAMETFNAEARSPFPFYDFKGLNHANEKAAEFARKSHSLYGIAQSNAHLRNDVGRSYISFDKGPDIGSAQGLKDSLKNILKSGHFSSHQELVPRNHLWKIMARLKYHKLLGI